MKNDMTYEDAMNRLEEIIDKLGDGGTTLDEALSLYEEGIGLIELCGNILGKARKKIEVLKRDLDGNLKSVDLEDSESEFGEIEDIEEEQNDGSEENNDGLF